MLRRTGRQCTGVRRCSTVEHHSSSENLSAIPEPRPAIMCQGSTPPEQRKALGIDDTLVRLSVGVEDLEDLR
jgi:O-acetylhomoserine/O-acetylserine sulfhydrylase-like pyridoxal-dependent enzyme